MTVYREYHPRQKKPACVSDMLPWRAMLAPNVVLQKDRGLQRTYAARGPDTMGLTPEVLGNFALRANEVLKRFGGQWMFQSEAQRRRVTLIPQASWGPYAVAAWIDLCRRGQLLTKPGSFETDYFFTLSYMPTPIAVQQGLRFFMSGPAAQRRSPREEQHRTVQEFIEQADYFMSLLSGMLAEARALFPGEVFTYLHRTVSTDWHDVGVLASWEGIDTQLADTPWAGGWYPILGYHEASCPGSHLCTCPHAWKVRLCSITGYPMASMVGVMKALDLARVQYRWCVRWEGMSRQLQEGILRRRQHAWVGEEKTTGQFYAEQLTGNAAKVTDTSALNKAAELDAARQETGHDLVAYGDFTSTIMVWDMDHDAADTKLRIVRQALQDRGFTATVETDEATPAWFATHPGNRQDHVARTPQSSLTLAHLAPGLNAVWRGPERDEYLNALPWLYGMSEGQTLIRLVNHIAGIGHFLMLGATGMGKSTLLNLLRAAWMQYTNAQAILFDLDGHGRLLTYLLGGAWHDLGAPGVQFAPFQGITDPLRQALILEWVLELLRDYSIPTDAHVISHIGRGLQSLAEQPAARRTMTTFVELLVAQSQVATDRARAGFRDALGTAHPDPSLMALVNRRHEIHQTLEQFTSRGIYKGLFDAATDGLTTTAVQTFEMRGLLNRASIVAPVLRYILKLHVELQMSTEAPMLLLMDDAAVTWMAESADQISAGMDAKRRQEEVQTYLQTTRKKSVSLGFSTHTLMKVFGGAFGTMLEEACPTRFYLPNGAAMEEGIYPIYRKLGLAHQAIEVIANARPQRDVFYAVRELGQQVVHFPHPKEVLACIARNSAADHAKMDRLMAEVGPERFAPAWMRSEGLEEAATFIERYHDERIRTTHPASDEALGTWDVGTPVYAGGA